MSCIVGAAQAQRYDLKMQNHILLKLFKNRWFKVGIIILLSSILFVSIYGRQTLATYLIYSRDEKQKLFLNISPEVRDPDPTHVKDRTTFHAFGYRIEIPLSKQPQYLNIDMEKGIFFIHEYGIIIHKPKNFPLNMYQHLKSSNKAEDVSHFKLIFENKFNNNFEFTKSCFFSKPTLLAIFKPIEETTLLYYQLIQKWLYANAGQQVPDKIFYFDTEHCKGFQVGDPSSLERVTLWLFPEPDKEIEILIQGAEVGKVKQEDIDLIITTFRAAREDSIES